MLLYLSGSACAGKTTVLPALRGSSDLTVHDTDEIGVPSGADTAWRQEALERWVRFALEQQALGVDTVIAGQSPLGELLATPSAPDLDGLAVCLLDVEDPVRRSRLRARDGDRWDATAVDAFEGWARWHREHALDPQARPEVIRDGSWDGMRWDRWASWRSGDPRWVVPVLDTTHAKPVEVAERVILWVEQSRRRVAGEDRCTP